MDHDAPPPPPTLATDDERAIVLALIARYKINGAAKLLGLSRSTLATIAAGAPVLRGSVLVLRTALERLEKKEVA